MIQVCIGLGSNVGNRAKNLLSAYGHIIALIDTQPVKFSKFYETIPVGGPPQPMFLNAALSIRTSLPSSQLLSQFQRIEKEMGRVRTQKWGPRIIDIDILLYGDEIINNNQLKIPHPLMHVRTFVLEPLAEIEPNIVHPIFKKTIHQLYNELRTSDSTV
ncbi:MAG: 2-amino-4-hydroxy-6-hydroxymethyldihydropteridine diphosphokinase [wastewater metagenome]|nr:2-amino-4-hydroxy-6-hydroxymethyldihydropteridine diphosphokinase [Candidatus Loosdrechtia aerotolerans]